MSRFQVVRNSKRTKPISGKLLRRYAFEGKIRDDDQVIQISTGKSYRFGELKAVLQNKNNEVSTQPASAFRRSDFQTKPSFANCADPSGVTAKSLNPDATPASSRVFLSRGTERDRY